MPTQSPSVLLDHLNPVAMLVHHTAVVLPARAVIPQFFEHDRCFNSACGDHEEITVLTPYPVLIHG